MSATDFFTSDEYWLQEQPNMNPYDEACGVLLRHLHVWVTRYTGQLCHKTVTPGHAGYDPFRRRSWRCWRFHWQPALAKKKKTDPDRTPPYRLAKGTAVAAEVAKRRREGENLFRDVVLAEAVTQAEPRATEFLEREYAVAMTEVAARTCSRLAVDAWSNVFGECFGPTGRLANYEGQRPLAAFLATVITHEVYQLMKKEARRRAHERPDESDSGDDVDAPGGDDPVDIIGRQECEQLLRDVLQQALGRLPPVDRLLLYYRYVKDLTFEEIGRILGMHKGTVLRRVAAATAKLAEAIVNVSRERKQERSVAECVEQSFQDLGCADLAELMARLLRGSRGTAEGLQGGGTES